MLSATQAARQKSSANAVGTDFCRIFEKDMDHLYLLSFLLTADHRLAEDCFVRGLEDAINSNRIFKEWAQAWARRMVIQNAIQIIQPQAAETSGASSSADHDVPAPARIAAIVGLPAFERFVFVMSVLERYSDQECAVLLDHGRSAVIAARTRALQQIAGSPELQRQLSIAASHSPRREHRSAFRPEAGQQVTVFA